MARRSSSTEEQPYLMLPLYVLNHANKKLSGSQLQFLLWVQAYSTSAACLRKGYSASEWTVEKFTIGRIMKMLGMDSDRGVQIMVRDLVERGLIRRIPEAESESPRQGYNYKLTSEADWDAAPDYKPKPAPKPAAEPEQDAATSQAPAAARQSVPPRSKVTISFPEPIERIEYRNEVNLPLEVAVDGGEFVVSVSDKINDFLHSLQLDSLEGGNNLPLTHASAGLGGGNSVPRTNDPVGTVSPSHPRNTVPPVDGLYMPFAGLRAVCDREVNARRVKGLLSDAIWAEVVENLGDTPEKFAVACFEDSFREKQQRNYTVKTQLLPRFAEDARHEWLKAPVEESAQPEVSPEQLHRSHINSIVTALRAVEEDRARGEEPWPEFQRSIDRASPEDLAEARALLASQLAQV